MINDWQTKNNFNIITDKFDNLKLLNKVLRIKKLYMKYMIINNFLYFQI